MEFLDKPLQSLLNHHQTFDEPPKALSQESGETMASPQMELTNLHQEAQSLKDLLPQAAKFQETTALEYATVVVDPQYERLE